MREPSACLCPKIDNQLSLPLSKNRQPILVFATHPAPDHSPGNLCRHDKCRLSYYKVHPKTGHEGPEVE